MQMDVTMMRSKKCDRCGKFYDHYDGMSRFRGGCKVSDLLLLIDHNQNETYLPREIYDLCPACTREFDTFIHGGAVSAAEKGDLE